MPTIKDVIRKENNLSIKNSPLLGIPYIPLILGIKLGRCILPDLSYKILKSFLGKSAPFKIGEVENMWLAKASRLPITIPIINKQIISYSWGEGPEILLVHGWASRGIQLHPLIAPLLQRGFKVVTFDFPGHGYLQGEGTTFLEFYLTLKEVSSKMHKLHAIVAHSIGCAATQAIAARWTKPLRLILLAPHYHLRAELQEWMDARHMPKALLTHFIKITEKKLGLEFDEFDPRHNATTIKQPVLLIHDRNDKAAKFKSSQILAKLIPNAQLIATEGLGHNKIVSDPAMINEMIKFLTIG